jgi:16S rRNA (uracil1498-N3)-methyltransferase
MRSGLRPGIVVGSRPISRRLRRFFVAPEALAADTVLFAARESHHIATVLRLQPGTRVVVFDGRQEAEAELVTVSDAAATARLVAPPRVSTRPLEITLLQGVARAPRMDLVVRMGTEVGFSAIAPVLTARSLPDPGGTRLARWRRIAQEAARQCGRADLPDIRAPAPLPVAIAQIGPVDLFVVPWEQARQPIGHAVTGRPFASAAVLIGPEGGLRDDEVDLARAAGAQAVSLGPLILRTETAGVITAAMLLYERSLRS